MSDYDDTNDLTDEEVRQLLRVIAHERDSLRKGFKALRIENHALKAEREKLLGCRDELREIAEAISDPRIHNTMTIAEWCHVLFEDYEVLRAKLDRLVECVEKAPHASMSCTSHTVQPDGFALPARCGCWKRAVLAEEGR